jgi:hypothetical protein
MTEGNARELLNVGSLLTTEVGGGEEERDSYARRRKGLRMTPCTCGCRLGEWSGEL